MYRNLVSDLKPNVSNEDLDGSDYEKEFIETSVLMKLIEVWNKCLCLWHNQSKNSQTDRNCEKAYLLIRKTLAESVCDNIDIDDMSILERLKATYVIGLKDAFSCHNADFMQALKFLDDVDKDLAELDIDNSCPFCKENFATYELLWAHMTTLHVEITPKSLMIEPRAEPTDVVTFIFKNPKPLLISDSASNESNELQPTARGVKKTVCESNNNSKAGKNTTPANKIKAKNLSSKKPKTLQNPMPATNPISKPETNPKPSPNQMLQEISIPPNQMLQEISIPPNPKSAKTTKRGRKRKPATNPEMPTSTSTAKKPKLEMKPRRSDRLRINQTSSFTNKLHSRYLKNFHDQFLLDFIQQYSEQTCLWQINSEHYRNRQLSNKAFKALERIYRRHYNEKTDKKSIRKLISRLRQYHMRCNAGRLPQQRQHLWRHLSFLNNDESVENVNVQSQQYVCNQCKKSYTRRGNLKKHILRNHPLTRCDACDSTFNTLNSLKRHLLCVHASSRTCPLGKCQVNNWKTAEHLGQHFFINSNWSKELKKRQE